MSERSTRKVMRPGKTFGSYAIDALIGQGGFSDVYLVHDTANGGSYAMKLERISVKKQALQREVDIYRALDSNFFPSFVSYGETPKYRFLVMERCGASLAAVRRLLPGKAFSVSTVLRVGIEMVRAIERLHRAGYLHRDIKPSNFLIRPSRAHPIALMDFGLCRPYIDRATGEQIPPRTRPGFVGTLKYASLNAHSGRELGRRDDLFSWFYTLLEMRLGKLPWASGDKNKVYRQKYSADFQYILKCFPPQMMSVFRLIRRLKREEEPNYDLIVSFMVEAVQQSDISWYDNFDWETIDQSAIAEFSIPLIPPPDELPNVPEDVHPVMPPF